MGSRRFFFSWLTCEFTTSFKGHKNKQGHGHEPLKKNEKHHPSLKKTSSFPPFPYVKVKANHWKIKLLPKWCLGGSFLMSGSGNLPVVCCPPWSRLREVLRKPCRILIMCSPGIMYGFTPRNFLQLYSIVGRANIHIYIYIYVVSYPIFQAYLQYNAYV